MKQKFLPINSQQFHILEGSHFPCVHHCISNIPSDLLRYPEGGNLFSFVKITSVFSTIIPLATTSSIIFNPFQLRSSLCCGAPVLGWCTECVVFSTPPLKWIAWFVFPGPVPESHSTRLSLHLHRISPYLSTNKEKHQPTTVKFSFIFY